MEKLKKAREMLSCGAYTCVLVGEGEIYTSTLRGVKPLAAWYSCGKCFSDFSAADKVVGRATAFLYILLGVRELYAAVISAPALTLLSEHGISVEYGTLTENIINRAGDGICPFEAAVLGTRDKFTAYNAILEKMAEMGISV